MKVGEIIRESVKTVPTHDEDFEQLGQLLSRPLPASLARGLLFTIIDDDDLNAQIDSVAERDIKADVRPIVMNWIKLNMPDLLTPADPTEGLMSPLGNKDDA